MRYLYTVPFNLLLGLVFLFQFTTRQKQRFQNRSKIVYFFFEHLTPLYFKREVFGVVYKDGRNQKWMSMKTLGELGEGHWAYTLEPLSKY